MAQPFSTNNFADAIHRARLTLDGYTPGPMTALSLMGGPMGWMSLGGNTLPQARILNNHQPPLSPIGRINQGFSAFPAPSLTAPTGPTDAGANARVAQGFEPFSPYGVSAPPSTAAPAAPQVPTPQPRPAAADAMAQVQAHDPMSWFQMNARMMRDPATGEFIDPQGAQEAQVRGPDLINKMLGYLHKKDMSSST